MKKNLRDMDLFTVFHFRDERARGRCVMLASAVFSLLATNLCMSGTLYTVFLTANHFSIVDTGVLGFLVPIASCFSVFSPLLLERLPRRRAVLTTLRALYYVINIVGVTVLTYTAHDPQTKLIGFGAVIFLSNICNALMGGGYSVWHLNFIPNNVRAKYFSYQQIISGLVSGVSLVGAGLIADAIRGSAHELTILVILRAVGFACAAADVIALALPKEYPYPPSDEKVSIVNTFRLPLKHPKFLITIGLMCMWTFGVALATTWTYYVLNTVGIKVSLMNGMELMNGIVLILAASAARRMVARHSWFRTFAYAAMVHAASTALYAFIGNVTYPAVFFVFIRIVQHIEGVALNLTYANFPFIHIPQKGGTYFLSFYTVAVNLSNFVGQMLGTLFIKQMGTRTLTLFGAVLEPPAILMLLQAAVLTGVVVLIFVLRGKLEQSDAED